MPIHGPKRQNEDLMACVTLIPHDDVALIEIDNPPVNAASHAVREGLVAALQAAEADPSIHAIVIAAAGKTFVAGADIKEFGQAPRAPLLPDVLAQIEGCSKPVVTAWHGTALGGGCEIGLASHARVIAKDGRIGLPEVKLGLIPGAGGTQRLPRLVGIAKALDLIVTGRMMDAHEAQACGLVDAIASDDLRKEAIAKARALVGKPIRRTGSLSVPIAEAGEVETQVNSLLRRVRGQDAPVEAARLVQQAAQVSLTDGLAAERETFLRLKNGNQSAALRYIFQAERNNAKRNALLGGEARHVKHLGVIGAGTMGAGISIAFLTSGFDVTVIETTSDALARGRERVEGLLNRMVSSGRMTTEKRDAVLAQITWSTELSALADVDLVVEAVFEDMQVKIDLLSRLEPVIRPDCVIATNTSYLDINRMAECLHNPKRFVGMHFFSPAHIMKLLEIIRAEKTSPDTIATALFVAQRLKKIAVVAGVCDGFIGNRIFSRYRQQCEFMLEEGALPHHIDDALEAYGFAMGPFATSDLAGLDISWARRKQQASTRSPDTRYVPLADMICEKGRFGQKTGAGWYRYENGKRSIDPEINALVQAHAQSTKRPQLNFDADMIVNNVLNAMADEGAKILAEGIAASAEDIDLVLLNGYGFPTYRGGPMFAAQRHPPA